jgi:HK97 family phage major capsid protein
VTTAVADGTPIVGAFREGATVWRRGGLSVEASNSHADYFRRNLTALRCEERLAITVFRDAAFQKVDASS